MSYTEHNNNMLSPDMGEAGRTHARVFVGPPTTIKIRLRRRKVLVFALS